MLPRKNRVLTSSEFRQGFRSPVRFSTDWASFYLVRISDGMPTRVGFVVGGAVGNAVVRNRVKRRLREASRGFVVAQPTGFQLVVRANASARNIEFVALKEGFDAATNNLLNRVGSNR